LELKPGICIIIELKYCPYLNKLTEDDKNMVLAKEAMKNLSESKINENLAKAVMNKIDPLEIRRVISKEGLAEPKEDKFNRILADSASEYLTKIEINEALAGAVKKKLSAKEKEAIYKNVSLKEDVSESEIEEVLSKASQMALSSIKNKNYHGIAKNAVPAIKEIIDLGLSIYGPGSHIKATFSLELSS
jgi:hypothetical protein